MCNTCNTTNTIATNPGCNPYNCYNPCLSRLLSCLFGNNSWGCGGGCANTANNGCGYSNNGWGQWGSQRVCRDVCGNLRVVRCGGGCSGGYSNGCSYSRSNNCCHSCNVCSQTFASSQASTGSGDDYYANQYGLNGRSNRCGCACGGNYGV